MSQNNEKEPLYGEPSNRIVKWFDNFWYHYKVVTVIAGVLIFTLIICIIQVLGREKYDYHTIYAGPLVLAVQDAKYIERAFEAIGSDVDGNGEVNAAVNDVTYLTDEEIAAAANEGAYFDGDFLRKTRNEFYQHILAGDAFLLMLSPHLYETVREGNALVPLSEVFDDIPEAAIDADGKTLDSGLVLSKTAFGQWFNGIDDLPEDTIVCVRRVTSLQKYRPGSKYDKIHENYVELLRMIAAYELPTAE